MTLTSRQINISLEINIYTNSLDAVGSCVSSGFSSLLDQTWLLTLETEMNGLPSCLMLAG